MASNVFGLFGVKQFKPTAPDKGSFPLDHEGECKVAYLKYIVCLSENAHKNSECRENLGPLSSVTSPEFTGIQSPKRDQRSGDREKLRRTLQHLNASMTGLGQVFSVVAPPPLQGPGKS